MATIRRAPQQSHLVDTLTIDNQDIAWLLNAVLTSGRRSHPDYSYVAVLNTIALASTGNGTCDPTPEGREDEREYGGIVSTESRAWTNTIVCCLLS